MTPLGPASKRRRSERHEIKAAIILLAPKATGVTATEWTQIHAKGCMVRDVTGVVLVSSNATRFSNQQPLRSRQYKVCQRATSPGKYSEIVWLPTGRIASTSTNADALTGLPNTYTSPEHGIVPPGNHRR